MGMTKLGEKIAAAPPSCYAKEPFLVEERTFFPPLGRSITINAAYFGSFTKNNEECDDGSPRILYESGTTRVHRSSGCKINFLRRRRQRLAALEKNRKKLAPAPNKPYGSPRPRIAAYDEPLLSGDKIAPPCVPTEPRFKFTEWREASLFPGRTIKIRNLYDTQNMGNTRVMKWWQPQRPYISSPSWNTLSDNCIEAKTKSEGLDDEKTSSSLASCIEEITKHVELLKQELEKPYTSTHCLKWADLLFSWIPKTGALPPYEQVSGEGWSVALSRGRAYYMAANDIKGKELTSKQLLDGVPRKHLMSSGGIDRLESTKDFMVSNDYVKDMVVHRRPSHPDEFAGYEILLEKLLARGPVVVVFDILPGYQDYDGKGIYTPDKTACQIAMFEIFKQHSVVVTGCGVGLVEGNLIEFWQTHDSQEPTWGVNGFGQLARRNGLIVAAVEFQF